MNDAPFEVRVATTDDAFAIADVQRKTWIATYPNDEEGISEADIRARVEGENNERFRKRIETIKQRIEAADETVANFVAFRGLNIIGFTSPFVGEQRRVGAVYVLPEYQGQGIGRALMEANLDWGDKTVDVYTQVARYNDGAIAFYKRLGFIETGTPVVDDAAIRDGLMEIPCIEMVLNRS